LGSFSNQEFSSGNKKIFVSAIAGKCSHNLNVTVARIILCLTEESIVTVYVNHAMIFSKSVNTTT